MTHITMLTQQVKVAVQIQILLALALEYDSILGHDQGHSNLPTHARRSHTGLPANYLNYLELINSNYG